MFILLKAGEKNRVRLKNWGQTAPCILETMSVRQGNLLNGRAYLQIIHPMKDSYLKYINNFTTQHQKAQKQSN